MPSFSLTALSGIGRNAACFLLLIAGAACGSDTAVTPAVPAEPVTMVSLGNSAVATRYTAEIAVRGTLAYTTTWGGALRVPGVQGNAIFVWDVGGNAPILVDSLIVSGAISTIGDVAVTDDGKFLIVATERAPGSIVIFDLTDPRHPHEVQRYSDANTAPGVHTAEIARVNGTLYGFLAIDPGSGAPARIVTVDLSNPLSPNAVFMKIGGTPYLHDTFARSGYLFVALWNDGMQIWDIGGGSAGAAPDNPKVLGTVHPVGGEVHNIWWYHDASGSKRYAFTGEEGPGTIGSSSRGDIHVIDVSDFAAPREVAFYHVDGAGTHNFSVDETNGILYAAYYNGGVRAIDVRGDLSTCTSLQQEATDGGVVRCDLRRMGREMGIGLLDRGMPVYVWGVQYQDGFVYASDMLNGIWKLQAVHR
jgi:hypothetical protein